MRKRILPGDVVEIALEHAFAFAQCTHRLPSWGELATFYVTRSAGRWSLEDCDLDGEVQFKTFTPLGDSLRAGLVRYLGARPIPSKHAILPIFRAGVPNLAKGGVAAWWLWDGEKEWRVGRLKPSQRALPIRCVMTHEMVRIRLASGWTAELDER